MQAKTFLKICLSLWILYHLTTIVTLANGSSYLGRLWGGTMVPYANALGLNSTWNFFSPDPAHTMYLESVVYFEDESGDPLKEPEEGFIPPEKDKIVIDSSRRRMLYVMRFLLLDENRVRTLMAPWLCREHEGASRVAITLVTETLPTFDLAVANKSTDVALLKRVVRSQAVTFDCGSEPDEVGL